MLYYSRGCFGSSYKNSSDRIYENTDRSCLIICYALNENNMNIFEPISKIKPKTWLKFVWWLILIILLISFLLPRVNSIQSGNAQPFDMFLFLILMALLLIPLFQEVEFFGIKLKKEVEELKKEFSSQFNILRTDIHNKIDLQNQSYHNFYFGQQPFIPPDSKLPELENSFRNILTETLRTEGISRVTQQDISFDISDNIQYLFNVRFSIEKELTRILDTNQIDIEDRRFIPVQKMISHLLNFEVINRKIADMIRKVYAICSPAIHAREVTEEQVNFVKDIAPELLNYLKNIQ